MVIYFLSLCSSEEIQKRNTTLPPATNRNKRDVDVFDDMQESIYEGYMTSFTEI